MTADLRKRVFVDPTVQGAIMRRAVLYWAACLLFVSLPLLIGQTLSHPERLFYEHLGDLWAAYWPVLTSIVLILPIILYDLARVTNRFAGPVVRLRRALRQMADGQTIEPIRFRDGDFWPELAHDFNRAATQLERHSSEPQPTRDRNTRDVDTIIETAQSLLATADRG